MPTGVALAIARGQLRQRRASYALLAVVVALGGGAAIGSAVAAYRTDRAYPDYVAAAEVASLGVNPSLSSVALTNAMRGFEGVREMHSSALLFASVGAARPATLSELYSSDPTEQWTQILGSPDGRFTDVDRPVVTDGQLPDGDREAFVNDDERANLEAVAGHPLAVGDTIDMSFWWSGLELLVEDLSTVVAPIGVESLRISGFGHLPDEVLPDELYPRQRIIVSADIARKYSCTADYRADMTDEQAAATAFPPNCSQQYWFYSFQLDEAPGRAASIREQFAQAADRLAADVPPWITGSGGSYFYISQDRAVVDDSVQRATRPAVTALTVFAIVAFSATMVIFGVVMARILRRSEPEFLSLLQLGASLSQRFLGAVVPVTAVVVGGVAGAIGVGALLSPIGPVGSVRDLAGSPGPSLPGRVTVAAAAVLVVALAAISVAIVFAAQRRTAQTSRRSRRRTVLLSNTLSRFSRPSMTTGASAALDVARPGTVAAMLGCAVAVVCAVGSLTFGSNLTTLVEHPTQYGWPWDVAVITNGGYDGAVPKSISASLDGDRDVDNYALYALNSSTQFGDQGVPVVYGFSADAPFEFPLFDGRAPSKANEAVLGTRTAQRLGVGIGDHITTRSFLFPEASVEIVGMAVLPHLGSFVSDRAGLRDGAFVLTGEAPTSDTASFVAINLRDGVDREAFIRRLEPDLSEWDALSTPPLTYVHPVRSPEIVNVSELRAAPLLLGGVMGFALLSGLALSIVVSVRDRQRELAILRVLGFRDAELRASVRWQACAMMSVGLLVGVPLGIVGGRVAWRAFADQLGVALPAESPISIVLATAVGAIVLALIAAAVPARSATRTSRGQALRQS